MRSAYLLIIPICLLLNSCGPRYQPKSLDCISFPSSYHNTNDDITLSIAPLTKKEANAIFDDRGGRLVQKKKSSLYLFTINNNRINPILLSKENISNKVIPGSNLAKKMYAHSKRRIIGILGLGLAGAGTLFLTAAYISILGAVSAMPALVKTGYGLLGASGLLLVSGPVGSYVQSQKTHQVNTLIQSDVDQKIFNNRLVIDSAQEKKIIVAFDKKLFTSTFSIRFTDEGTNQLIPFQVHLGGTK